ncbi:MAG: ATP-binding protein [Candidatus Hydrothermales bacterium]
MIPLHMYEFLRKISVESSDFLRGEMERLLLLQNIMDGKIILNKRKINLYDFVTEFVEREKEEGIIFQIDLFSPMDSLFLEIDKNYLNRVIKEIVNNSKIAISRSGLIKIKINKKDLVILEIIDSGIGISRTEIEKIFTPFFLTNFRLFKGHLGIGLSIVKGLLKFMGSEIKVESEYQRGTKVTLFLI